MSGGGHQARRNHGYESFSPGENPEDNCQYVMEHKRKDFIEGWNKAKDQYECEPTLEERLTELENRVNLLEETL